MERQSSFAGTEYAQKKKTTRREKFLAEMERVVPWARLIALVAPFYPKGLRGRPPVGVERMLRLYFLQQWYGLADEAIEDALYDSHSMRFFAGIDLGTDSVPDATTVLQFRRLLERNTLTVAIFEAIATLLDERKLLMREGTIVDATILSAPPSTKNAARARDPEMHSTRKGQQWYFGMKAHIGVDAKSGLVHSLHTTAAHHADVAEIAPLLHGQETRVHADAGYTGAEKRPEFQSEGAPALDWCIATKRGKIKAMPEGPLKLLHQGYERLKAQIRAIVEHPFHVLKDLLHYRKVRYHGLAKNTAHLHTLFALVNLMLAKRRLLAQQ
jgi:IS5 family transposase